MAGQDSRVGDRSTSSMRIKLKYPDVDTFIQKYAVNISRGGIFIATKQPKPIGTYVKFEFLLSDATTTSIIRGEGQVQWTKEFDPAHPMKAHGMGVKFMRLDAESQLIIDRALRWRADHGTNPGVPLPIPTSSAHTISTPALPREEPAPVGDSTLPESPPMRDEPPPEMSRPIAVETGETPLPPLAPDPPTREVPLPFGAPPVVPMTAAPMAVPPMAGRGETRPIAVADRDEERERGRAPHEHTRPIALPPDKTGRGRSGEDIDALAVEWGLSEERLARILKRARPRMAEATAELERLLLKPPKLPTPTRAEALQQLKVLLARKNGRNGTPTH